MFYALLYAIWRRIYGEGTVTGLLGNRTFQSLLSICFLMSIYVTNIYAWQCWVASLIVSSWLTFQFWSRAVKAILDCGDEIHPKEYYNRWFRVPLDWIYTKLNKPLYIGSYDWWYCTFRYTLCLLPIAYLFSWWYLVAGLSAAPIYWGCKKLYHYYPKISGSCGVWLDHYKNLAEIIHGFVFGLTVSMLGWGI